MYRVIGQAIDNAIEHAQPSLIQVEIGDHNGKVTFQVKDDGRGSSEADRLKAQTQGTFGLKSMTARIQNLGGDFLFSSAPNKGTVVSGWLPKHKMN